MSQLNKARTIASKLERYTSLHSDELSEAVYLLEEIAGYLYLLDIKFQTALITEMESQLKNYEKHATITKHTETYTRNYETLEWNDE